MVTTTTNETAEEQRRFESRVRIASSELDDCEDVWTEELGKYIIENRLRAREVEAWFEERSAVSLY